MGLEIDGLLDEGTHLVPLEIRRNSAARLFSGLTKWN